MSAYAVVYNNLKGPPNLNPVERGGFETEDVAISFAASLRTHETQLIRLLRDGTPILWGQALQTRVKMAGPRA